MTEDWPTDDADDDYVNEPLTCANCNYAQPAISDEPDEGPLWKCHRYPPTLLVVDDEIIQAFPDADEVCGEHSDMA